MLNWIKKYIRSKSSNELDHLLKMSPGLIGKLAKENVKSIVLCAEDINNGFVKLNITYLDARGNELLYLNCPSIGEGETIKIFDLLNLQIRIRQE